MADPEHQGATRPRRTLSATTQGVLAAVLVWAVLTVVFWVITAPALHAAGIGTHAPPPGWVGPAVIVLELAILVVAVLVGRSRHRRVLVVRGW